MTENRRVTVSLALAGCLLATGAQAQGGGPPHRAERAAPLERPSVMAQRTEEAIDIDGRLTEGAWASAGIIAGLTQVEPDEGAEPSERTEVLFLHDKDNLYIGVRAYDSEPDRIRATEMQRDAEFETDDFIAFALDTFHDRRNGYRFSTNPLGARTDTLIENNQRLKGGDDWDGVWYAKSSITPEGWVAEIAIPFKTVSFDPSNTTWGFNFERTIRRKNETARWSGTGIARGIDEVALAGDLNGLDGIEQGLGLDVVPGLSLSYLRGNDGTGNGAEFDPFIDAFYRVTPDLTAAVTVNTDFAETEVDEREINLGRFDVFFPEKRDFFLQDAGIFEFGGIVRNGRPFFSRRIGLGEEGEDVDIIAGAKLTGRVGPLSLGGLAVRQDQSLTRDEANLFVLRPRLNVLAESSVGMIATHGNPVEDEDNSVLGFDVFYRDSNILPDRVIGADLWVQKAFREDVEADDMAYGGAIRYPNEPLEVLFAFQEIQQQFRPALGFVNRRGIRQYAGEGRYRWRRPPGSYIRFIDSGISAEVVEKTEEDFIETAEIAVKILRVDSREGERFELGYKHQYEKLVEEFEIVEGIVVPVGAYHNDGFFAKLASSPQRSLTGSVEIDYGEFLDGTRAKLKPAIGWRPSRFLLLAAEYEYNHVDLNAGDFDTHLLRGRTRIQFSPNVTWNTLVQWDNLSEVLGINSRLRWTIEPGRDLFLIATHASGGDGDDDFEGDVTELIGKLQWTFRF